MNTPLGGDLTTSPINRRNILNNDIALREVQARLPLLGVMFEGQARFTRTQVARYFDVDIRTISRLIEQHGSELHESGYELISGPRLKALKQVIAESINNTDQLTDINVRQLEHHLDQLTDTNVRQLELPLNQLTDINVGQLGSAIENEEVGARTRSLGVFNFKSLLNVSMLLADSERARRLRSSLLDIIIDVLNQKLGGSAKFVNQREEEFLPSAVRSHNYQQKFATSLSECIEDHRFKLTKMTDLVYAAIFHENAKEYRQVLNLQSRENVRATMYSEVLDLIASYENGFADKLESHSRQLNRRLSLSEAVSLFGQFEKDTESIYKPLLEKARSVMASRDMALRDALHTKLKDYVGPLSSDDFEKFLGERSLGLVERLLENKEVFLRLRDR
jgi:hypothetical protein